MDEIYKIIEEYNPNKKRKILIIFDDMIVDMPSNKKCNPVVTELFIRERKLNISHVFIPKPYFAVQKNIRLNSKHYFVMKFSDKKELQQTAFNNSSDIDFEDFRDFYNGTITLKEVDKERRNLLVETMNFKSKIKSQN